MNGLARAVELTEEIRQSLAAEVAVAREERVLIRRMDADGLNARAAIRGKFNAKTTHLMTTLGKTLGAAAADVGISDLTMDALQAHAPAEGLRMAAILAEVRTLAASLSELDRLNRMLSQRALSYVRAHLAVISPKPAAYDRRGSGATVTRTSTFVRVV
jgi:hypothetical protein